MYDHRNKLLVNALFSRLQVTQPLSSAKNPKMTQEYDLIVVGSGFAGCMTVLNFLEQCKKENKHGKVALIEIGKEGERSGASKWTMAYLRLDKDNKFDPGNRCFHE